MTQWLHLLGEYSGQKDQRYEDMMLQAKRLRLHSHDVSNKGYFCVQEGVPRVLLTVDNVNASWRSELD